MTSSGVLRGARVLWRDLWWDMMLMLVAFLLPIGLWVYDYRHGCQDWFVRSGALTALIGGYLGYRSLAKHYVKLYRNTERGFSLFTSKHQRVLDGLTFLAAAVGTAILAFGDKLFPYSDCAAPQVALVPATTPSLWELASYWLTAAATVVLAWFAAVEMKKTRGESDKRVGRLNARARYYGILVRRSLRESVRALDDNNLARAPIPWHAAMRATSANLGEVEKNLQQMLESAMEMRGGSGKDLEDIVDHFYSLSDSFNELAFRGTQQSIGDLKTQLDEARNSSIVCWQKIEGVFGLAAQQPHSFEKGYASANQIAEFEERTKT